MDRFFRYAAYLVCLAQVTAVFYLVLNGYSRADMLIAFLLFLPPAICTIALYFGPDLEERRLTRKVSKARLKQELLDLEKKKN